MSAELGRLTEAEQWKERWEEAGSDFRDVRFNIHSPSFREKHRIFCEELSEARGSSVLEIGAYPGSYLWYFYSVFGCEPWGVEYVEALAAQASMGLAQAGVPAKIIAKDFFDLDPQMDAKIDGWDIAASFGFVEHFDDPIPVIRRHFDMVRKGGLVIVSIPNHAGICGSILKIVDREVWSQHNHMALADLIDAFNAVENNKVCFSGHIGHIGFWNTGLSIVLRRKWKGLYPVGRAPLWMIEQLGRYLVPNNRITSPEAMVIARKLS